MAKDSRDSRKKNEFITGCRIPIDINEGQNEMRGKINGKPLKEG